ncbi:hypothetical protein KPH14_002052 [Odynerus spinipes]|uniref:CCHC-type domain-containing protein n=1 Tax=Odynerus spinipes TaxID=1348599 RepID=A0AAD9VKV4_9HYME|nr:hypothetical protein KPH14_002052 [Odynerus spinipes]
MNVAMRRQRASVMNVCFNCLWSGHRASDCNRGRCKICRRAHHTLLHTDESNAKDPNVQSGESNAVILTQTDKDGDRTRVLLTTAIVYLRDKAGIKHECRALLDPGSQSHFLTAEFCDKLRLLSTSCDRTLAGIGQTISNVKRRVKVDLQSMHTNYTTTMSCLVITHITDDLPNDPVNRDAIAIPANMRLTDPKFDRARKIDLLIGGELFWNLLCVGQYTLGPRYPILQKTQLGWVVGGRINLPRPRKISKATCHLVTNEQLSHQLQRFWEIEDNKEGTGPRSIDTRDFCEQHFQATTTRDSDGRYVVSIPFNERVKTLGESRTIAERRLHSIERKLARQPDMKKQYTEFMAEYEALGHMTQIREEKRSDHLFRYYLPHHAVMKEGSTTTKLRVVFDGSTKTSSGISVNETQRVGPPVHYELFAILMRFRKHTFVLSADVTKMYRQIRVTPEDRRFQSILWRSDLTQPIQVYELNTVTYGTSSAPFLATRVLRKIGEDCVSTNPRASHAIISDFYIDDLLTGTDTLASAKRLYCDITAILKTAGLELRKWASNEPRIFETSHASSSASVEITADKDPKTLGLLWIAQSDILRFSVAKKKHTRVTKRTILSEIAQIFDPLGIIGPATITAKILLQRLWQLQIAWDESLPQDIHTQWEEFRSELEVLNEIAIPRHVLQTHTVRTELHGFCDASEKAYGACIYLRSTNNDGHILVRLLCAKSRVCPLKKITLPRLELCGALLLAHLCSKAKAALNMHVSEEYYWCDSTIVLAWIKAPSSRWKTFVANRTAEIQRKTNGNWRHIVSEDNPADIISRGICPAALSDSSLWWNGPEWLVKEVGDWPMVETTTVDAPEEREQAPAILTATISAFDLFTRYSSYTRLLRVTCYCLRFIQNVRKLQRNQFKNCLADGQQSDANHSDIYLNAKELEAARISLLRVAQSESFSEELHSIREGQPLQRSGKLHALNPFIDDSGLLRVGGRLSNAPIEYQHIHPIILASEHPFTTLIIRNEHIRLLHAGCQSVIASLRMQYWPLSCRNSVKKVIRQCVRCYRANPTTTNCIMGDLPADRVTPNRPFYKCGVDYAAFLATLEPRVSTPTSIEEHMAIHCTRRIWHRNYGHH